MAGVLLHSTYIIVMAKHLVDNLFWLYISSAHLISDSIFHYVSLHLDGTILRAHSTTSLA